jgi:hypothetical protein
MQGVAEVHSEFVGRVARRLGRSRALIVSLLVLGCAYGPAHGDGVLLLPSELLGAFTEQSQLAVIEVNRDRTCRVDLFVSLLDTSGTPHEVHFALPLQTLPEQLQAQEVAASQFRDDRLRPLDGVFWSDRKAGEQAAVHRLTAGVAGALVGGPLSLVLEGGYVLYVLTTSTKRTAGALPGAAIGPEMTAETDHSKIEVYPALRDQDLARLAGLDDLPTTVREALKSYVGRPFALVRLRTIPSPRSAPAKGGLKERGIVFTFDQGMLRNGNGYRYDFPLGTGQGWANPIPATAIYVTADDDLNVRSLFPKTEEDLAGAAAGVDRQVQMASYYGQNLSHDVRVELLPSGKSDCVAKRDARRRGVVVGYVAFPVLGALAWLLGFRLTAWRGQSGGEQNFWRLALLTHLRLWFPMLAFFAGLAGLLYMQSLQASWPSTEGPGFPTAFVVLTVLAAAAWRLAGACRLPDTISGVGLVEPIAASGIAYFILRLVLGTFAG